jgi:hypothetical protein
MINSSESNSSRSGRNRAAIALLWLATLAAAITGLLLAAAEAEAGIYRANQCTVNPDSGHGDLFFRRTSDHYRRDDRCGSADGLSVTHSGRRSPNGRFGAWTMVLPDALEMKRVRLDAAGRLENGHKPEVLVGSGEDSLRPLGSAIGGFHELVWEGENAQRLEARLRCAGRGDCGEGERAHVSVRGIGARLSDRERPEAGVAGELTERTGRGEEAVDAVVADAGSGIRRTFIEVNGEPLRSRVLDCSVRDGVAIRLRPCPRESTEGFSVATESAPFLQGPNTVRACALDYSDAEGSNRACAEKRLRVDNLCPISESDEGARLDARLRGGGRRARNRGEGPRLVGRLVDESGAVVAATEVCIAARPEAEGFAEEVAATPVTGPDGRFRVRLEAGPSREVRVAYWADDERVVEEMLALKAAARPRLRLSPSGRMRNGQRLRFEVSLPGPRPEGRSIIVQASGGHGWQRLRAGRTNDSGVFRSSYRFHATTGRRTYRFRAFVPEQRGYPYERGRSPVRKKTVVGR